MSQALTMHGARAVLSINGSVVGIFSSVQYGVRYDASPVYILGRFSAAEIALTGMETVSVSATGFRIVNNGPYAASSVPTLQALLHHEDIVLSLSDRATGAEIMTVVGVRPTGYSTTVSSRALQEMTVDFVGLRLSDEHDPLGQDELSDATHIP